MLLLACVLAGCILGWMRGGKLRNFLSFPFRFLWLPCGAFLLQASVLPFSRWIPEEPDRWLWLPLVLSYSMLAIFFIGNYRIPSLWVMALGLFLICPIFIDIGKWLDVIGTIRWFLPPAWYLQFF